MTDYVIPLASAPSVAVQGSALRFPLQRVFCVGRNYHWQGAGAAAAEPAVEPPYFFMKPADAVVPAAGSIPYPSLTRDFCHEIELVVAIGKDGFDIAPEHALEHVWGYAAGLDLTRREVQAIAKQQGRPWEGAKAFDASAPTTPLLPVTVSGHPVGGAIWLDVNGEPRQRADLADLIWPVPDLISVISQSIRLRAGDLVFTGTPTGVAPLLPGDIVTGGIDGIGQFSVSIAAR